MHFAKTKWRAKVNQFSVVMCDSYCTPLLSTILAYLASGSTTIKYDLHLHCDAISSNFIHSLKCILSISCFKSDRVTFHSFAWKIMVYFVLRYDLWNNWSVCVCVCARSIHLMEKICSAEINDANDFSLFLTTFFFFAVVVFICSCFMNKLSEQSF